MMEPKKIGIMGGTFDPPHVGHLAMAEYVREELELNQVWFIPTGKIPHKDSRETAASADRLAMVELAIAGNPWFRIESLEVENGGYSYTFETLEKIKTAYPEADLTFIVGADSLDYMECWREPERIFRLCTVAAVNRMGFDKEQMAQKQAALAEQFGARIQRVDMPLIGVSSTEIRERIRQGRSVRYLVRDEVLAYIKTHDLYLENKN